MSKVGISKTIKKTKKKRNSTQQWSVKEKAKLNSCFRMSYAYIDTITKMKSALKSQGKTIFMDHIYEPFEGFIGTRGNA